MGFNPICAGSSPVGSTIFTMYEPKYKLNKHDAARFSELLLRECASCGKGGRAHALTSKEKLELEKLTRKRSRKICSHPKVKESIQFARRRTRKVNRLLQKLKKLINEHQG